MQVAMFVDQPRGGRLRRRQRDGLAMEPAVDCRNRSTTASFSSGSLEHVA
jgi:hypothetical protein